MWRAEKTIRHALLILSAEVKLTTLSHGPNPRYEHDLDPIKATACSAIDQAVGKTRPMDTVVLTEKLESLRRCIWRIETRKPDDVDRLKQDIDLQDILVLNLTRAVQLSVDIGSHIISGADRPAPQTMGQIFTLLQEIGAISASTCDRLKKAVGFRNVAIHPYEVINRDIVYAVCEHSIADFRQFALEISHAGL